MSRRCFIAAHSTEKEEKAFCHNSLKPAISLYISHSIPLNTLNCSYYTNMKVIIVIMTMPTIVNVKLSIKHVKK